MELDFIKLFSTFFKYSNAFYGLTNYGLSAKVIKALGLNLYSSYGRLQDFITSL